MFDVYILNRRMLTTVYASSHASKFVMTPRTVGMMVLIMFTANGARNFERCCSRGTRWILERTVVLMLSSNMAYTDHRQKTSTNANIRRPQDFEVTDIIRLRDIDVGFVVAK